MGVSMNKPRPMHLLVLDTPENAAAVMVNLLTDNKIGTQAERVTEKARLMEALADGFWDLVLLNDLASEVDPAQCINAIRKRDPHTAVLQLCSKPFGITELGKAYACGLAGLVSLDCPQYSLAILRREYERVLGLRQQGLLARENGELLKRCKLLLSGSRDALAYVHSGMHVYANASYLEFFGYTDVDELICVPFIDLIGSKDRGGVKTCLKEVQREMERNDAEHAERSIEVTALGADETEFSARLYLRPTNYEGEPCLQVLVTALEAEAPALAAEEPPAPATSEPEETEAVQAAAPEEPGWEKPRQIHPAMLPSASEKTRAVKPAPAESAEVSASLEDLIQLNEALEQNLVALIHHPIITFEDIEAEFYDIELRLYDQKSNSSRPKQVRALINDDQLGLKYDRWAIEKALRVMVELNKQGQSLQFFYTFTGRSLQDKGFADWLIAQVKESGLGFDALVPNLTETDVLRDADKARDWIQKVQRAGLRVCIRDFSNGPAIFEVVKSAGVALVKLESGIARRLEEDENFSQQLRGIVRALHEAKARVVVGGVNAADILAALWAVDVDLVQGPYFQKDDHALSVESFNEKIAV